jgi:hypothetical protein
LTKPPGSQCPDHLDPAHFEKLTREHGLTLATIIETGMYTERNTGRLRVLLRGFPAEAPAIVIPGYDAEGRDNHYPVVRCTRPLRFPDGSIAKYLVPRGVPYRLYFPPFAIVRDTIRQRGVLVITEGVFKALALCQLGIPAIGLMGVDLWSPPKRDRTDKSELRRLHPDLEILDKRHLLVILFDTDRQRNGDVNRAATQLAEACWRDRGIRTIRAKLPVAKRFASDVIFKTGVDDFIQRLRKRGRDAVREFNAWFEPYVTEKGLRALDDYRRDMIEIRQRPQRPAAIRLDRGPTGCGKTYADIVTTKQGGKPSLSAKVTLMLVPTHENCAEVVAEAKDNGVQIVPFPQLTKSTCLQHKEAQAVREAGLDFGAVLCPTCPHQNDCFYRPQLAKAMEAEHSVATQARGAVSMAQITKERLRITIHENPTDMLRPLFVTKHGLRAVQIVAGEAEGRASYPTDRGFYRHLGRLAGWLDGQMNGANESALLPPVNPIPNPPRRLHRDLYEAVTILGAGPPAVAMRLTLAAALGHVNYLAVSVITKFDEGGQVKLDRSLIGAMNTEMPTDAAIWVADATADKEQLERITGNQVIDVTPRGRLFLHHPAVQIIPAKDVTRGRQPARVAAILRGILYDLPPHLARIGLLTHLPLIDKSLADEWLGDPYRQRLALVHHFGGGLSRGSNRWHKECDALIVLGTPRVGPEAVHRKLIQLGNRRAMRLTVEEAGWGPDWWGGETITGRRVSVRTPHYRDHDWHAAYQSIVRSELVQAIGRGRGILPDGIPVYVVSRENLAPPEEEDGRYGLPLADHPFAPLTAGQVAVLGTLVNERGRKVLRQTSDIARRLSLSYRTVGLTLAELEKANRVERVGERGGWLIRFKPLSGERIMRNGP